MATKLLIGLAASLVSGVLALTAGAPPPSLSAHDAPPAAPTLAHSPASIGRQAIDCLFAARPDVLAAYANRGVDTSPSNYPFIAYNWFNTIGIRGAPPEEPAQQFATLDQYLALIGCAIEAQSQALMATDGTNPGASGFVNVNDVGDMFSTVVNGRLGGFRWMAALGQFVSPRLTAWDHTDPPDIIIRRDGDLDADGNPSPLRGGMNLGTMYWQPMVNGTFPRGGLGRTAQIYTRLSSDPTSTSIPGSLYFATTPPGSTAPRDALVLTENQRTQLQTQGDAKSPALGIQNEGTGLFQPKRGELSVTVGGNCEEAGVIRHRPLHCERVKRYPAICFR